MNPMAIRLPESELKANQTYRRKITEAELLWDRISQQYQAQLKINQSLRIQLRYQLDKIRHKLLREPAGF